MLTDRQLRLAAKAAKPFLPAKLEDYIPSTRERLPVGVYKHFNRYRTAVKQPDGRWKIVGFLTPQEAVEARNQSQP